MYLRLLEAEAFKGERSFMIGLGNPVGREVEARPGNARIRDGRQSHPEGPGRGVPKPVPKLCRRLGGVPDCLHAGLADPTRPRHGQPHPALHRRAPGPLRHPPAWRLAQSGSTSLRSPASAPARSVIDPSSRRTGSGGTTPAASRPSARGGSVAGPVVAGAETDGCAFTGVAFRSSLVQPVSRARPAVAATASTKARDAGGLPSSFGGLHQV